jgi:hypothetical protein
MHKLILSLVLAAGLYAAGPSVKAGPTGSVGLPTGELAELPATCRVGELFFVTDATAGQNAYGCTATDTWTLLSGGGGDVTGPASATADTVVIYDDTTGKVLTTTNILYDTGYFGFTQSGEGGIYHTLTSQSVAVYGGQSSANGGTFRGYGSTHATKPGAIDLDILDNANSVLRVRREAAGSFTNLLLVNQSGLITMPLVANGAAGAIAVNSSGDVAKVSGTATDCVLVDGTSGPCGTGSTITLSEGTAIIIATVGDDNEISVDEDIVAIQAGDNALSGINSFPATASQTLTASDTIVCNATRIAITAASPVTVTTTPTIADSASDGQMCILQNVGANDITLTSGASENLKLSSATVAVPAGRFMTLIWDSATSLWTQGVL